MSAVSSRRILGIDTSGATCAVGLQLADGQILSRTGKDAQSHNEELSVLVSDVLQAGQTEPGDLAAIVLGSGPGSFTGLRIAYSFVKGFAFGLNLAVVEVSSLQVLANEFVAQGKIALVLADARREEFFSAVYAPPEYASAEQVEAIRSRQTVVELHQELTVKYGADKLVIVSQDLYAGLDWPLQKPARIVDSLIQLGGLKMAELRQNSQDLAYLAALKPGYLRAVAAQTIAERAMLKIS